MKLRFMDIVRAILPNILYEKDDGTFEAVNPNKHWQVGNETISEQELADAVNEELKEIDNDTTTKT